ncbi:MAG: MMPL family transporter [Acidimicrobiia bacterium]|nr:MMPL family transporter [Acidimicrobiia bacterium]NNF68525.1 MMPL family transporter [Acidimicrobiia bacterium]
MHKLFDGFASAVAGRPRIALAILFIVTVGLAAGSGLLADQADNSVFLPDDSDVALATATLSEEFPDSAGLTNVTIIHRGDVLTPAGLAQIDEVITAATADPAVAERLAVTDPVVSIAGIYKQALQTSDLSTVSQAQIDQVTAALADNPEVGPILEQLVGEADGEELAISSIRLRSLGDPEGLAATELEIADIAAGVEGPLDVRSLSAETINQESAESSSSSMTTLMFVAFAVIVVLLYVFFRTGSDVLLSLGGLGITVVGTLGFQGIMGPDGLGVIGAPNRITTLVPIMLIGLVVDYAIQSVAHYRELRVEGKSVPEAARGGLRIVALPLGLAAGTTMISFLTNVASPIPANRDFGIVAAFGVVFGLAVMLTLVPAARAVLDGRRESKGTLDTPKPIADAIPGAGPVVERVGVFVARKPMVVLVGTAIVTIVLGAAAFNINTEFDSNDFLPSGGESLTDIEALEEAFGGQTEAVTVLVEAELSDDRTLRNLLEISRAFEDDLSRPTGAAGDITASLGTLFLDWSEDSGEPGDNYDPELVAIIEGIEQRSTPISVGLQEVLNRLESLDPVGFAQVAINDPDGPDLTLVQFSAFSGDQDRTRQMVEDVEGLWYGDRTQITVTSGDIISLEVTDAMTETQTGAIAITIVAALIVLMLFFWATEFKPMLAVIAVFPIVLVLLWVLGTMTLLGISYNVVTALITALSIGIGVDYTIHVIHRFTEELEHSGSVETATTRTLSTTGSALLGSALTTALGFGVLLFSPLVPFQQFGLVTGITILYALVVAVAVVPPLMVVWAAYHEWRRRETSDRELFADDGGAHSLPAGATS